MFFCIFLSNKNLNHHEIIYFLVRVPCNKYSNRIVIFVSFIFYSFDIANFCCCVSPPPFCTQKKKTKNASFSINCFLRCCLLSLFSLALFLRLILSFSFHTLTTSLSFFSLSLRNTKSETGELLWETTKNHLFLHIPKNAAAFLISITSLNFEISKNY